MKINEVSIYDHELSAARVAVHYAALPSARIVANDVSGAGYVYDPDSITSDDAYIDATLSAIDTFADTPSPDFVGCADAEIFPITVAGSPTGDTLSPETALAVNSGEYVDTQDTTGRDYTSPTSDLHPDSTAGAWYTYTPSEDGIVTLDTVLSELDTYIFLMADDLTTIVAEDDDSGNLHGGVLYTSWLQADVYADTLYYICMQIDPDPEYSTGIQTLSLSGPVPVFESEPNTEIPLPAVTADSVTLFPSISVNATVTMPAVRRRAVQAASVPGPPTDLVATAIDQWSIQLDWTNATDVLFDHVIIMRSDGPPYAAPGDEIYAGVVLYELSPGDATFTDSLLTPGRWYWYNVISVSTPGRTSPTPTS